MSVTCPIECMTTAKEVACPDPDFLERNGAWLLTVIGMGVGTLGTVLTYFLKSRCSRIKCWGVECVRDVVKLSAAQVEVVPNKTSSNV